MKIFNEIEINNIGNKKAWEFIGKRLVPSTLTNFFEQGVEFAESQLEELAIEFIEWAGDNRVSLSVKDQRNEFQQVWYQGENISAKELFQQFIKERNG